MNRFLESWKSIPAERKAWVWLVLAALLLPFTAWQTVMPWAAWVAPVFLLRFSRTARRSWLTQRLVFVACALGILAANRGMPFNPLGLVGNVILKGWIWSLPYWVDSLLAKRFTGWVRSLAFPLAFAVVDWVLSLLPIASSGSPAYSQAGVLPLLQLAAVTGTPGITFLIAATASAANALWERGIGDRGARALLAGCAALLGVVVVAGSARVAFSDPAVPTVLAGTVSLDPATAREAAKGVDWVAQNWRTNDQREALRRSFAPGAEQMLARTAVALQAGARIVSWQETGAWVLAEDEQALLDRAAELARQHGAYVQVALEVLTHDTRPSALRNESVLLDPNGTPLWTYDKAHTVPYDEAFATAAGPARLPVVDTRWGRLSTATCYDTYFPSYVRQAGKARAAILLAPSNDSAPFAESAATMAPLRAVENGLAVIRATGNGISTMCDGHGQILARQSSFTSSAGVMVADVPVRTGRTPYSVVGDLFSWLCAAALAGLVLRALLGRRAAMDRGPASPPH